LRFLINPISRRILSDLRQHVQAFTIFAEHCDLPLPAHPACGGEGWVDLEGMRFFKRELRDGFEMAGIHFGALGMVFEKIGVMQKEELGGEF
jgi:hypothetical protein